MVTRKYYEKNDGYMYVLNALTEQFGEEMTIFMVEEAVSECNALCKKYLDLPKKEKVHTERMIFPRAALYLQMIRYMPREQAVDLLMEAIRIGVEPDMKILRWLTKAGFVRSLFLWAFSKMISTSFNKEAGFQMKVYESSTSHFRADVQQCPYHKYCTLLGCKELTTTFCYSDDCIYGGLTGIEFRRSGTIGRGDEKCDFDLHKT